MKKNKFIYSFSAFALACIISFSGVGGSYIQAHATSVGIERPVWNDDASVWENIKQHLKLYAAFSGVYTNPTYIAYTAQDFYDFMISDGISHDAAHGVFCDCDVATHNSFDGSEHGGGGHVRDGISMDEDGNVTYSDEVSDLFHGFILDYLDSNSGYIVYKTPKATDLDVSNFKSSITRDNFIETIDNIGLCQVKLILTTDGNGGIRYIPYDYLYVPGCDSIRWSKSDGLPFLSNGAFESDNGYLKCYVIEEDWSYHLPYRLTTVLDTSDSNYGWFYHSQRTYTLNDIHVTTAEYNEAYLGYTNIGFEQNLLISNDGRAVKLWYNLDAFKNYDVGNQMYYVTDSFNSYDSTVDNSVTMTSQEYAYYNDNSTTIYQTIQNNIDNSGNSDLTEKDVQDIVDAAVQEMKDSIANSGNQGGNDSGDSENGGNGIGNLVDGIGKLLDTILSLIGKVMGVVADFTQSILDLFSGFTDFTDGFSNFLSGAFSFIPQEIWNVIQVGLSLMILLAVIKFLRK